MVKSGTLLWELCLRLARSLPQPATEQSQRGSMEKLQSRLQVPAPRLWICRAVAASALLLVESIETLLPPGLRLDAMRRHVMPCDAMRCHVLPCPALPYPALPCPALPCPALSCPALRCPRRRAEEVTARTSQPRAASVEPTNNRLAPWRPVPRAMGTEPFEARNFHHPLASDPLGRHIQSNAAPASIHPRFPRSMNH